MPKSIGEEMLRAIIALAALGMSFSAPSWAGDKEKLGDFPIDSLSVGVDDSEAKLTVIFSRMEETGTAAAIGGLIGAAINSGINAEEDADRAEGYSDVIGQVDLAGLVEASLRETLEGKEYSLVDDGTQSHALQVDIKEWGLIKVSFNDNRVRAYLRLRLTMRDGRTLVWDVYENETGKKAEFLSDYPSDVLKEEMTALATKTGKRIAYEIIYR